ncbi:hypothetical protein [Wolbachia endosymbiont (group B) of Melanostoma mellinum]|uniref:hypothetical protein n=1 Tax=Wolbachia endosymbiont (group B) of Melanostoma mellinum TaxID=2954030 RepID=UPI00222F6F31|nr:hypothetical protein [Wolbachia endosymbiont (group B) of Melanostoma mellinum]
MFRASIEEIKEQLELGVSESIVEANLVKLQGLIGKYSLSPVIYENGLGELEDFISNFSNAGNYLKVLKGIRSEFREELKSQPALLKECIEGEANLGRKEGEYYKSLLDDRSLKNVSPERVISESPILDKATVSKRGNNNYKLRNISKLLFSNPGQALTLFLAAQSAFASAANIQMSNSTGLAIGNDTLSFDNNLSNLSEFEGRINENVSIHSVSKSSNFRNSNKVRKEVEVVAQNLNGMFTKIPRGEFKDLRDTDELVEVLTYVKSQRSKRSANESLSEMETVPEDQGEIVTGLENKVRELKKEIEEIKNSSSASDKRYKEQISPLEGQLFFLQRSFNDMKRRFNQTLTQRDGEISGLKVIVENLEKQVKNLKETIQENERKYLYVECTRDIEARKFKDAEKKLAQINNETETSNIVKNVYSGRIDNFPLLLEFGKGIGDTKLILWVYKALDYELRDTRNSDVLKVIELAKDIKSKVINQQNADSDTMKNATAFLNSLKGSIRDMAVKELSDAMKNKTYDKGDRDVFKISNAIFSLNGELFKDFITEVIDNVYGKVSTESVILDFIYQSECTSRRYGYEAILKKMKAQGHLDYDPAALELARCIKDLVNGVVCGLSPGERFVALGLKNELPKQLQVAIFAEKVCIKNVGYNEYLYAASDGFKYEGKRRVFTWRYKNEKVTQGVWQLERDNADYYIRNTQHNEYLSAGDMGYDLIGNAFTLPRENFQPYKWKLNLTNSGVNILHTNKYKYTSGLCIRSVEPYDDERNNVAEGGRETPLCMWEIEDCSNMRRRRDVQSYSEPSSYLSDIALEKTTGKNSSFISR